MAFNIQIFPSGNDVNGGTAGAGKTLSEANISRSGQNVVKRNTVRYGLNYVSASGLVATFNAIGEAQIRGYDVVGSGTNPTITLGANTTSYVWLQLTRDNLKKVTGAALVATTSTVPPTYTAGGVLWTDAVLLASLVTNATTVTTNTDLRPGTVKGSLAIKAIGAPPAPSITTVGTAGTTTYNRQIVGIDANGNKGPISAVATITTGNATLNSTNYLAIALPDMAGYEAYDVLTDSTHSLALAVPAGTTYNDQGGATSAYTAPSRDATGDVSLPGNASVAGTLTPNAVRLQSGGDSYGMSLSRFGAGDYELRTNDDMTGNQQDATKPSWAMIFGASGDNITLYRRPPGGAYAQMVLVSNIGDLILSGRLYATQPQTLRTGNQETGYCGNGIGIGASSTTSSFIYTGTNFKTVMANTPSSITLNPTSWSSNAQVGADLIQFNGFRFTNTWASSGNSSYYWLGTYTTVGN